MNVVHRWLRPGATLAWVAAGLAVLAIVVLGAVASLILVRHDAGVSERPAGNKTARTVEDYRRIREEESRVLREYQWIDRTTGTARIPIERAMTLILERGSLKPAGPESSR